MNSDVIFEKDGDGPFSVEVLGVDVDQLNSAVNPPSQDSHSYDLPGGGRR